MLGELYVEQASMCQQIWYRTNNVRHT